MKTSETDLGLLEEYLDGALDGAALPKLRQRLATDAPFAAALAELQAQRALRQAAYQAMEPNDLTTQQLMWRVRGAMLDQQQTPAAQPKRMWSQWHLASIGSAAAACLVLGFMFGRLSHGGGVGGVTPGALPAVAPGSIASNDMHGSLVAENHTSGFIPVSATPKISVPISDAYGRVVALADFRRPQAGQGFYRRSEQGSWRGTVAGEFTATHPGGFTPAGQGAVLN